MISRCAPTRGDVDLDLQTDKHDINIYKHIYSAE